MKSIHGLHKMIGRDVASQKLCNCSQVDWLSEISRDEYNNKLKTN